MDEVLRALLAVLVAVSVAAIVAWAAGFVVTVVWTIRHRHRPDPLAEDLDRALDEILLENGRAAITRSHVPTRRLPTWRR